MCIPSNLIVVFIRLAGSPAIHLRDEIHLGDQAEPDWKSWLIIRGRGAGGEQDQRQQR